MRNVLVSLMALTVACTAGRPAPVVVDPGDAGIPSTPDGGPATASWFLPLRHSPIQDENQLAGGTGWKLRRATTQIAAYCDHTSYLAGEQAAVSVAGASPTSITWELWRVGYYGGTGGRKLASGGPVSVPAFTQATMDPATGAVSAGWTPSFRIDVPQAAVTGVYLVRISSPLGETYATFVVREPSRAATVLYPVSTNTYQAYNPWGGTSLYVNSRPDWKPNHAYAVSFDRPYLRGSGTGELMSRDHDFITFAEGQGYDIAYITDTDLDGDPHLADRRRMIVIQGHSEYWTAPQRDALDQAISSGTNAAFLAANDAYWQVRFQDASRRVLIGYKEFANRDPAAQSDPAHVTTKWRNLPLNRPENAMIGEMFGAWMTTDAPLTVTDASSWPWTGAGVSENSQIAGVYGNESDHRFDNGQQPANVKVLGNALVENYTGATSAMGETTLYTAPSGAMVFSAGSITWSRSLAGPGTWDPRIQQLVANLFSRFAGDGTLGPSALHPLNLPAGSTTPSYRGQVSVSTWTRALVRPSAVAVAPNGDAIVADADSIVRVNRGGSVTTIAGGVPGYVDGSVGGAQFRNPHGIAVAPNGDIFVSDTGNNVIRRISGSTVSTFAGNGQQSFADGPAAQASFAWPMGIAFRSDGTLLVADMWTHRLRAISPAGIVSTWAGNGASDPTDGPGASAHLSYPFAVAALPNGDAVIAEPSTGFVRLVSGAPGHAVSELAGSIGQSGWTDGPAATAGVSETLALAARADGHVILLDGATSRIRTLGGGVVETLAGGQRGGTVDGPGESAGFGWPRGVAAAPDGTLLVVDALEHSLRQVNP